MLHDAVEHGAELPGTRPPPCRVQSAAARCVHRTSTSPRRSGAGRARQHSGSGSSSLGRAGRPSGRWNSSQPAARISASGRVNVKSPRDSQNRPPPRWPCRRSRRWRPRRNRRKMASPSGKGASGTCLPAHPTNACVRRVTDHRDFDKESPLGAGAFDHSEAVRDGHGAHLRLDIAARQMAAIIGLIAEFALRLDVSPVDGGTCQTRPRALSQRCCKTYFKAKHNRCLWRFPVARKRLVSGTHARPGTRWRPVSAGCCWVVWAA